MLRVDVYVETTRFQISVQNRLPQCLKGKKRRKRNKLGWSAPRSTHSFFFWRSSQPHG